MPTYDYKCEACGHEFETFQSITDSPLKKCPKCSKRKLKRLIGMGAALIFRGSGFYCTDYRRSGAATSAPKAPESSSSKDSSSSSSSTSDSGGSGDGSKKD